MRVAIGVTFLGVAAALFWLLVGWGAYRELHQRSRVHSIPAFLFAGALWIPVGLLMILLVTALVK